jgi:hypothetical protein
LDLLKCPSCQGVLEPTVFNTGREESCPSCATKLQLALFPAALDFSFEGASATPLQDESESSCLHHAEHRAETSCVRCGGFLCAPCAVAMGGDDYCASCLESAIRAGELPQLQTHYICQDTVALLLAFFPLMLLFVSLVFTAIAFPVLPASVRVVPAFFGVFMLFPTLVSAPMALYLGLRSRRRTLRPVGSSAWRSWVAIGVAAAQISLWVAVVLFSLAGLVAA